MIGFFSLVKKDLQLFYSRPLIYVLAGVCCILWSIFFGIATYSFIQASMSMSATQVIANLNLNQHVFSSYISVVHYLLLFILAAITMKFFTEEKRMNTFPLLMSSPLTSFQVVLAKFTAGGIVILGLLFASALYPLSLTLYTSFSLVPLAVSYFGLFLILLLYLSSGLLASALSESMLLAMVLAIIFSLGLLLLGVGKEMFQSFFWQDIFSYLSIDFHFRIFREGSLSFASIIFFTSLTGFFLFLTERTVEYHRWK